MVLGLTFHSSGEDMSKFKPDGWHSVTPRIFTDDVAGLAGFLKIAFGASGKLQSGSPTEMRIGDSVIMISDGGGVRGAMPAFLYVYVENADETYQRAIAAGAESIERPADSPMATGERWFGMRGRTSGRLQRIAGAEVRPNGQRPHRTAKSTAQGIAGAPGRNRTSTVLPPPDFESDI